ncbi:MAG: hypothetical protein JWN70_1458, partial [Planctomycetaceae bacterium]|nr:hypothetical protein [Planctomycetaceae bacterium]
MLTVCVALRTISSVFASLLIVVFHLLPAGCSNLRPIVVDSRLNRFRTSIGGHNLPYQPPFFVVVALVLIAIGCESVSEPDKSTQTRPNSKTQPESKVSAEKAPPVESPSETTTIDLVGVKEFLRRDSFCRDVLSGMAISDFLSETPTAMKDAEQSRPDIRYTVYRESMFMYEFLDGKLFAIRYTVPRSAKSASDWIAPYRKAFGPPTNTIMPDDFQKMKASKFLSWDLPQHKLRINFADLPASFGEADLDLFGQFINLETAKEFLTRRSSSGISKTARVLMPSHPLQLAFDIAVKQDEHDPLVIDLWTGIGKQCAQSGHIDAAKYVLKLLKEKTETELILSSRGEIATELVTVLVRDGHVEDAITVADQIPLAASRQRCNALSAIAIARAAKVPQDGVDPFLMQAIDSVSQGVDAHQRTESLMVIIRNLVNANGLALAEVLAAEMERTQSSRRGWGPIAVQIAIDGDVEKSNQILNSKLMGLDQDLYQFIETVLIERRFQSRFEICRAALQQIKNPVLIARGSCVLFGSMTEPKQLAEARRELGRALENAERARVSQSDTAQILLSAISPMVVLEDKSAGLNICRTLQVRFAPELAAEGYRQLATHAQSVEKTDAIQYLATAE